MANPEWINGRLDPFTQPAGEQRRCLAIWLVGGLAVSLYERAYNDVDLISTGLWLGVIIGGRWIACQ